MPRESRENLIEQIRQLQSRLNEAEATLDAIRSGEVDAVVGAGAASDKIYTLTGADTAYRLFVEQMAEGAATLTPQGLVLFANEQFAAMLGVSLEHVIGSDIRSFVPDDPDQFEALLRSGMRSISKAEMRLRTAQGVLLPVYASIKRLALLDGECACLTVTDLTEQKRNEETVAAGMLARSILDQSAEPIFVLDAAGRITHASKAAERFAEKPVLWRKFDEVFETLPLGEILSAAGRRENIEGMQATAGNMEVLINAAPLSSSNLELLGCIVSLTNITELKRIEATLRDSEARERRRAAELQALMEAAPAAIFIARDPECKEMVGNTMTSEFLRVQHGKNVSQSASEEERPKNFHAEREGRRLLPEELPLQTAARTGVPVQDCELDFVYDDGTVRNLLGSANPLFDDLGQTRGAVGAFIDITARKQIEKRLRETQKLESIGMLAGGIAHDFNNLLVGVIGSASLAQMTVPPGTRTFELLDLILKSGEQAAHLTRQLLAYAGKGRFVTERFNLSNLVREIVEVLQPSISKRIELRLDLQANLPLIEADRGQIQQIVMNLAINASEAIGNDTGVVSIKTGVQDIGDSQRKYLPETYADLHSGKYVYLEISDTGSGMDPETMRKIFDPFFSTKFLGRGLGLAAASGIVRGHKGAINVTSAPGKGSCFKVLLRASAHTITITSKPAKEPAKGKGTVLVVDDEATVRMVAKALLEHSGFRVMVADTGPAALELFERAPGEIALVLLDLSLPKEGGNEILPKMLKIRPDTKVLVTSGYSEDVAMQSFKGLPVSGFIQKPYAPHALSEKVRQTIESAPKTSPGSEVANKRIG